MWKLFNQWKIFWRNVASEAYNLFIAHVIKKGEKLQYLMDVSVA